MAKRPKKNVLGSNKDTFILSGEVQDSLLSRSKSLVNRFSSLSSRRDRFIVVDKAMMLEDDKRYKNNPKHDFKNDHRPPVLIGHLDAAYSFYVNLFASGEPVFKVVGPQESLEQVKQMQAKVDEDSERYAYTTTLCKAIRDCVKYDEMTLVCEWTTESLPTFEGSDPTGRAEVIPQMIEGNELKYVSPYNTFYDENVVHMERHVKGSHSGYHELIHMTELHKLVSSWVAAGKSVMNITTMFNTATSHETTQYHRPTFNGKDNAADSNGLASLWGMEGTNYGINQTYADYREQYELTTIYMRIIPSMYNIPCSDSTSVQIFKVVLVNMSTIILVERITNAMQFLPIFTAQMNDENWMGISKSMGELLLPTQNMSTEIADVTLGLLYKAAGDKGIYDSRIISKHDIESKNPHAKIPAKPSATGRSLRDAYYPLPFEGGAIQLMQMMQQVLRQDASDITGQNNATRGQFQKGNRTLQEFQDVMSNADSLKYTKALLIENSFLTPIKNMIRNNILQYMQAGSINAQGQTTEVNPVELRQAGLKFRIADGLKNVERIANTGALGEAMQLLMQQAQTAVGQGYDPFKALIRYITLRGVDLSDIQGAAVNPMAAIPAQTVAGQQQQLAAQGVMQAQAQVAPQQGGGEGV